MKEFFTKEKMLELAGSLLMIGGWAIHYFSSKLDDEKMKIEIKKQVELALKDGENNG